MATKTGLQTLNHKDILEVDGNPAIDGGTSANDPGSIALVNNEGSGEVWLKTGSADTDWQKILTASDAGIGEGEFLRLAIFDTVSAGTHLDDQVVQNGQNISVKIDAQASRTAGIEYLIPNPGDGVASVSFVLTEGAQTINGDKTFGDNVIVDGDLTVNGTLTYINTTNLEVTDKLILLNKGGAAGSAGGSGLEIEEDGAVTGYLKLSSDRKGFELLASDADGALTLSASLLTAARTISAPDADGIAVLRASGSLPVAGQVTYWDNENQVVGSSGLTYDAVTQSLTVAGGITAQNGAFQVQANGALSASNGNFTVDSSGLVSAVSGAFQVQASGALSASNGNFTVDANGAVVAADGGFNILSDGSFNAAASKFVVDADGDLTKINNVSYSFPTAQAAGANYALLNDGSGVLAWGKVAITLQDAYDNSCLGGGGDGGNSGGQPTLTYMTGTDSSGTYQVTWNAANATGKYVQLQQYSAMTWAAVSNLGLATGGSGSAMSAFISNGASLRLKLFDDYMYMMPTNPEVLSSSWTASIGGGGGPLSITFAGYGPDPMAMDPNIIQVSWTVQNPDASTYYYLWKETGPGTYSDPLYLSAYPSVDATADLSQIDPAATYVVGGGSMNTGVPPTAVSPSFTIPEGTGGVPAGPETTISNYSSLMSSIHQVAYAGAAKFGQKIVVAGGAGTGGTPSNQVSFIDVAADAVTTTTSLSVARYLSAVAANSSYVIVAGGYASGYTGELILEVYSEATQSWATKTLPNPRYKSSAVEIGGLFYILGGSYYYQETYPNQLNLDIYNPATDSFSSGASMPNPHNQGEAVVASDGKIYYGSSEVATDKLDVYDPATDSWQTLTVPGVARYRSSILTVGGKVYVAGGYNSSAQVTSEVQIYDIAQAAWQMPTNLPEARAAISATVLGNKLLFLGGAVNGDGISNSLYVYDTVTGVWGSKSTINTGDGLGFAVGNKAVFLGFGGNFNPTGQVYYFTDSSLLGSGGARGRLGGAGSLGCVASITTNSQIGDFIVAGTEAFVVTAAGGLLVGTGFAVDADGETLKTNGVTYTFPAAQGLSGQVLKNDGMGVLSWDYPMAIGDKVDAGTSGSLLFVDATGNLAQNNANLYWDATNQRLGLGTDEPAARLDVNGDAIIRGDLKQLTAAAPFANWTRAQVQVETTDATETSALALPIPDNSVVMLKAYVLARRSGGASGAELDSGVYIRTARIKKVNGIASLHAMQTDYTSEDQRGWSATIQTTGDNDAHVYVQGAAGNDIDWTVNYEYIVLDGTSGSGGGNSGGQLSLSSPMHAESGSNYDIYWNTTGDVSGKYVNVDLMSAGVVTQTAYLAPASAGYYALPLAAVSDGIEIRLRLFSDNMGMMPVSPEVASATWTVSVSGGGGGGGGIPTFSIGSTSSATGTVSILWNAANASAYPEIGLYKVTNPGAMQSYTFIQNVSNTMGMTSGTVSGLSWGLFNPAYTYTLGLASTGMEQTPFLLDATGFTVAEGTLVPVVESAAFGSEMMGYISVSYGASNVDSNLYAFLQKFNPAQFMYEDVSVLGSATDTSGSVLVSSLENGAEYRVAIKTAMIGGSVVGSGSVPFNYVAPSTITYISTSQNGSNQVFNWSSANASGLYVGLRKQGSPGMFGNPIMLGSVDLGTAAVAIADLTDLADYKLQLYSDSAGVTALGYSSEVFNVDFTIPATLTYTANSASGSDQVITWTAANAIGLYVGLLLDGSSTPIMLGSESDGSEAVAQSLLTNGSSYTLQLYSDSAGTTAVSNTATSGFTVSWYLQYQWQGTGVDQSGTFTSADIVSMVRLAVGSGSVTYDNTTNTQNVTYRFAYNENDATIAVKQAAVDYLYNATAATSSTLISGDRVIASGTQNTDNLAAFAEILNGAKVGEMRQVVRANGNYLVVKVHAIV